MKVIINQQQFEFLDTAKILIYRGGIEMHIRDPRFQTVSETVLAEFEDQEMQLPIFFASHLLYGGKTPASIKIYTDDRGNKRLESYFKSD